MGKAGWIIGAIILTAVIIGIIILVSKIKKGDFNPFKKVGKSPYSDPECKAKCQDKCEYLVTKCGIGVKHPPSDCEDKGPPCSRCLAEQCGATIKTKKTAFKKTGKSPYSDPACKAKCQDKCEYIFTKCAVKHPPSDCKSRAPACKTCISTQCM